MRHLISSLKSFAINDSIPSPLQAGRVSQDPPVARSAGQPELVEGRETRADFFGFLSFSKKEGTG